MAGGTTRQVRRWAVLAGVLALLAGAGGYLAYRATRPQVPAVDLRGADPAVVRAVEDARRAVEAAPRSAQAWGALGRLLLAYDFRPEAETCLARAEQLDPREPRWPYLRGLALQNTDPEAALPHLRRAADLCGADPPAVRLRLAGVLEQLGRLDDSADRYREVLAHDADNPWAHLGLARLACERDDLPDALSHLARAAPNRSTRKEAYTLLAQVHQRLGDPAAAARDRDKAAGPPDDLPGPDPFRREKDTLLEGKQTSLKLIRRLHAAGRVPEAQELAGRVERQYPDVGYLMEGRLLEQQGDLAGSARAFRQAIALAPDAVDAYQDLGSLCLRRGQVEEAAANFRKVLEREPDYGPAHRQLAECRQRQGDPDGALRHQREAARLMPHDADVHRELGEFLARAGRADEARAQLRQALQLTPDDSKARDLLEQLEHGKAP